MAPDGALSPEVLEVDGVPLPPTNYVNADHSSGELRLWVSVSTRQVPREQAFRKDVADGFIVLKDRRGVRVVADGIGFANENKTDPSGRFLYVNETMARRLSRFPIRDDASLGPRATVAEFGPGTFPDGFEFDALGGIWIASVVSNRLLRIAPDGSQTVVLEDSDPELVAAVERKYQAGTPLARADIDAGRAGVLGNLASVAFGGPDLRTVFLGSLFAPRHRDLPLARSRARGRRIGTTDLLGDSSCRDPGKSPSPRSGRATAGRSSPTSSRPRPRSG